MAHLDAISIDDLHDALDLVGDKRSIQQLLAAISFKNGVSQTELADWFGTGGRTIYSWLIRLTPTSHCGREFPMIIGPVGIENSQTIV